MYHFYTSLLPQLKNNDEQGNIISHNYFRILHQMKLIALSCFRAQLNRTCFLFHKTKFIVICTQSQWTLTRSYPVSLIPNVTLPSLFDPQRDATQSHWFPTLRYPVSLIPNVTLPCLTDCQRDATLSHWSLTLRYPVSLIANVTLPSLTDP